MLNSQEYTKLASVVGELAKAPIWVDDSPGLRPLELRAKARRLKLQHDIKCIVVDYMQLMDNPGRENRQQEISEISRGIKAVARELSIPVICLSQLNRASEGRDGHRPRMSDLRESGSIEQDADVIMLLHREDYYRMSEPDFQPDNIAEVIIAKQRNGPTGTIKLTFLNKTTRFENLSGASDPRVLRMQYRPLGGCAHIFTWIIQEPVERIGRLRLWETAQDGNRFHMNLVVKRKFKLRASHRQNQGQHFVGRGPLGQLQ
jgi:replicative DNA helicase